jgi:hypothetical protein
MKKLLPLIFIAVVVFVFFWQFFLKGLVAIPADSMIALYHPFRDYLSKEYPRGYPFKNFLITDPVLQQYPWRQLAVGLEKTGQIPSWNPYSGAGEPLLANIQSASLYPLNILLVVLPFIQGWMALVILQMLLGGIFTFLFLKNLGLKKESSLFGSTVFILSGFYFSWVTWNNLLHVALWMPLILLAIDKITENVKLKTENVKLKSLIWPLVLVFALSSSLLAGHLQLFFYSFLVAFFYFILRIYSAKERIKKTVIIFVSFLIFLLITSIQWLPTLNLIDLSSRAIDQMNWQSKEGWFIPWQHLIQFVAPDFFGNPTTLNYWGTWNYAELVGYVGIFSLCFAAFSIFVRKEKTVIFFFLSLLVAVVFSFPDIISKIPFELKIPLISSSQPTRLMMVIDFALAVLSAFGVEEFLRRKNTKKLIYISLLFLLGLIGIWAYIFFNKKADINLAISQRNLYLPSLIIIIQVIFFFLAYILREKRKIFLTIFYLILFINIFDLMRYGLKFNPFVPTSLVYPNTKITTYLSNQSKIYPWRFMGSDYVANEKRIFPPNTAIHYGLYAIDDYNPLLLKNYQDYIAVSEWGFKNIPDFSFNRMIIPNNYNTRLIDLLGVKYVVTINNVNNSKLKFLFNEGESRVYENKNVFPRAFMVYSSVTASTKEEAGSLLLDKSINLKNTAILDKNLSLKDGNGLSKVVFVNYSENKIVLNVETSKKGLLVLTDNYYPGWEAAVDGKKSEILKTDYTFRGLVVPAGKHIIEFTFHIL